MALTFDRDSGFSKTVATDESRSTTPLAGERGRLDRTSYRQCRVCLTVLCRACARTRAAVAKVSGLLKDAILMAAEDAMRRGWLAISAAKLSPTYRPSLPHSFASPQSSPAPIHRLDRACAGEEDLTGSDAGSLRWSSATKRERQNRARSTAAPASALSRSISSRAAASS